MNPREITALIRAMRIEQHNLAVTIDVLTRIAGRDVETTVTGTDEPIIVHHRRKRSAESIRKQIATRAANAKKRTSRSRVNGSGKSASV